jgi:hypothetical protein
MISLISLKVLVLRLGLSYVFLSIAFLKPMYKVLSAESCSGGDPHSQQQWQRLPSSPQPANQSIKIPHPPSGNLLYSVVNKEVEQQFLGRGCDIVTRKICSLLL